MGLQSTGLRSLHLLAHVGHAAGVHCVVGERALFYQPFQMRAVNGLGNSLCQARTHLRLVAITDGFDQEITKQAALELKLAKHIEDLAT